MIAVIADDFTGAAEIAGICLRYKLETVLFASRPGALRADAVIINTDSRSMTKEAAQESTRSALNGLLALQPGWIYKKTDSVLRGYVLDELLIQMELTGFDKVLFIPANPSLGRTIRDGEYFIDGKKINETAFAFDPEFPVKDSSVVNMMGAGNDKVRVSKYTDGLKGKGIVIGEAAGTADISAWVKQLDKGWMTAGGGDFFSALLDQHFPPAERREITMLSPHLYVSGTAFSKSKALLKEIDAATGAVVYLPGSMPGEDADVMDEEWLNRVISLLEHQERAIIGIDEKGIGNPATALQLRTIMAKLTARILKEAMVKELFIEGGSTAAAILNELGITMLSAVDELERGVVRMKTGEIFITVKPGSYELPAQVRSIYM